MASRKLKSRDPPVESRCRVEIAAGRARRGAFPTFPEFNPWTPAAADGLPGERPNARSRDHK